MKLIISFQSQSEAVAGGFNLCGIWPIASKAAAKTKTLKEYRKVNCTIATVEDSGKIYFYNKQNEN